MANSENQVELKLGLDISGVQKALYDMIGDFTGTGKEFDKITKKIQDSFKNLEAVIKRYGANSKEAIAANAAYQKSLTALVVNGVDPATQSFQQLGNAMSSASNVATASGNSVKKSNMGWTNLALVIQDLPYGFRGIQNNLPALVGSFAAATGPIYLGISAIIAAVTAWDMGLFSVKKKTDEAKKSQDSYNDSLKTAMSSAFGEMSQIKALISVVENQGISIDKRRIALKKLQDEYPGYFKNMSVEKTSISQLETATNNLTQAIIARAEANAMTSEIEKLAGERYNNIKTIEKNELAILNMTNALVILSKKEEQHMSQYGTITRSKSPYDIQLEKIKKIEEENKKLTSSNETLGNSIAKLQNSINFRSQTTVGLNTGKTPTGGGKSDAQKEAERMAAAEKYLADWQIKLNTDIANAQVKEGDRLTKLREDRLKKEKEDYDNNLKYFDQYYNNLFDLATNDKNAQKEILQQQNNNLLVALANGTIIYDDYIKRIADNTRKVSQLTKSIAEEAFKSMLQIGNGIMSALGPSFDMLIEKGASLGDVLTNAFQSVLKQLAKVVVTALIAVTLMSIFFGSKLAAAGGFGKVFGGLIGQGMGLGGLIGGSSAGATATNTAQGVSNDLIAANNTSSSGGRFTLRGQDLLLSMNRSEKSLNLRRG
jgi:hypothetical protein